MNARVDRLREKLEQPFLVSDGANVRYLSGLASSNAALLIDDERVRVFTDYRYAESARAVEGAEFVEAKRDLYQTLSELLSGPIGFEATSLTFERYSRLHAGGVEPVTTYGLVEELRVVKDDGELSQSFAALPAPRYAMPICVRPLMVTGLSPCDLKPRVGSS